MTNQRFTETLSTGIVTDNFTGKEYKCEMRIDDDLLKLLNELHEENENVKDANAQCCIDYSAMRRDVLRYKEENEQLKQRNDRLEEKIQRERRVSAKQHLKWSKEAEMKIKELSEENEQLKTLNIPLGEVEEMVVDYKKRVVRVYYND